MTGQCEYHAAAHGISNLGPSLASEKTYLLCRSELRAQHGEPRTFGTIANNFATQSRMALLNRTESSQQQFVTLTGDKVADAEYDIGWQRIRFWIENIGQLRCKPLLSKAAHRYAFLLPRTLVG